MPSTASFIRALPKCELHLHLEGSIEPETLVSLSARHDEHPLSLDQARELYRYPDFQGFLLAFKSVTRRLQTPEDYELITYELLRSLSAQGVIHAEVYISVGVIYYWTKLDFPPIFEALERGRIRGEADFGTTLYWIFDAVRHFGVQEAARVFSTAAELHRSHPSVVGVGLGGDEIRGPAADFRDLFAQARDNGLHLTCHAGENTGPESIWAALNIGAERLGHVLAAQRDPELLELLARRQVPVEICPSSNIATGCCPTFAAHPLRQYFDSGLMVTLNSDDPPMFSTTLANEYLVAHDHFAFTREQLRELAANSIEASFLPAQRKIELLREF
jgi:adenosine deaminase/aminodeoxyfutalosine deaminase